MPGNEMSNNDLDLVSFIHKNTRNPGVYIRTQIIMLFLKGMDFEQIARETSLAVSTVVSWVKRYQKYGIPGLFFSAGKNVHEMEIEFYNTIRCLNYQ